MRPFARGIRYRQVPAHLRLLESKRFAEAADGIQDMEAWAVGDALVDEEAVEVLGTGTVIPNAEPGWNEGRQQIGARCHLHLQQHLVTAAARAFAQLAAQAAHAREAGLLVVLDEVDTGQSLQQPVLALADDPG